MKSVQKLKISLAVLVGWRCILAYLSYYTHQQFVYCKSTQHQGRLKGAEYVAQPRPKTLIQPLVSQTFHNSEVRAL
jgi:hypothetical protein